MRSFVFKGNNAYYEERCQGETHHNDGLRDSASASWLPLGVESDEVLNAVYSLRGFVPPMTEKPTTGLHAVMMGALSCARLRLYGFAGEHTIDGHEMHASHDIEAEHALLAKLVAHDVDALAMSDALRRKWRGTEMAVVC